MMTVSSPRPFSPEMEDRELARRDEIEDRVSELPVSFQHDELQKEQHRRHQWEELRKTHNERGGGTNNVASSDLSLTGNSTGGTGTAQQPVSVTRSVVGAHLEQRPPFEPFDFEADTAEGSRRRRPGLWDRLRSSETRRND